MESIYNYQKLSNNEIRNRSRRNGKWIFIAVGLVSAVFGLFLLYVATSPLISIWGMRNAAIAKDGKRFASYIDFPIFKENLKAEFNAAMMEKMSSDKSLKDNPFAGLGMMLAPAIVNNMVDAMVTPQGIERMMNGQVLPQTTDSKMSRDDIQPFLSGDIAWGYESFGEFYVKIKNPDGQVSTLIFYRHWLGDWKLSSIKLPRI